MKDQGASLFPNLILAVAHCDPTLCFDHRRAALWHPPVMRTPCCAPPSSSSYVSSIVLPSQTDCPLQDRIASFAREVREKASLRPLGKEKDDLPGEPGWPTSRPICGRWANSPGLEAGE